MSETLGLSIGTRNLVGARDGGVTFSRRAVLTRFPNRPAEVGVPSENPALTEPGLVLTGFVERVGDPVPIVAADGTTYRGERLAAEALEALTRTASPSRSPQSIGVTIPAHWGTGAVSALNAAIATRPALCLNGRPAPLVSDAVAALTAMQAQPGLPARGVVALCDFGATGTSVTLADAAAGFRSIGPTLRYEDFSGELIDQSLLRHILAGVDVDPSNTSAVSALGRLREQCRIAKEQLSSETAAGLTGPLPGSQSVVRITRGELESLLRDPLDGVIAAVDDTMRRNNIRRADLTGLATAGGGARIPLVTQRLSEALRITVTTTHRPEALAALGASLIAARPPEMEAATSLAATPLAGAAAAAALSDAAYTAAAEPAVDLMAWSQETSTDDASPGSYTEYEGGYPADMARPEVHFLTGERADTREALPPLPLYRRPGALFAAAACAVLLAAVGLIWTLDVGGIATKLTGGTEPSAATPAPPPPQPAPPAAPASPAPAPAAPETVVVQQPAPRQQAPAPRQQAPAPRQQAPAPAPRQLAPAPQPAPPPQPVPEPEPEQKPETKPETGGTPDDQLPGGTGQQPNGTGQQPNGTGQQPNGTGQQPNGTEQQPNGTGQQPNGTEQQPDGTGQPGGTVKPPGIKKGDTGTQPGTGTEPDTGTEPGGATEQGGGTEPGGAVEPGGAGPTPCVQTMGIPC